MKIRFTSLCFNHILESKDSSGSGDLPESSTESDENNESGESESGESGEAEYKRAYIPRDNDDAEDDDDDSVDSAVENSSKEEDTSDGEQEGSAEQDTSTRGKVITDTMGDIAKAALDNKIERKSDIIHSLPQNTEETPSSEEGTTAEAKETRTKSGAALKNLFTALADGESHTSGSGEELAVKEKVQSTDFIKQVSVQLKMFVDSTQTHSKLNQINKKSASQRTLTTVTLACTNAKTSV